MHSRCFWGRTPRQEQDLVEACNGNQPTDSPNEAEKMAEAAGPDIKEIVDVANRIREVSSNVRLLIDGRIEPAGSGR